MIIIEMKTTRHYLTIDNENLLLNFFQQTLIEQLLYFFCKYDSLHFTFALLNVKMIMLMYVANV